MQAKMVAPHNPAALAAMEGRFESGPMAEITLIGQPNVQERRLRKWNPISLTPDYYAKSLEAGYDYGYTEIMKTAISIPDKVFRAAEELSRRLRMSRSELYSQAVAAFIASHRSAGVKEKLDAIYGEEDSALDPVLAHWQSLALPREDW
jgi:hypothetical protein